MPRSWSLWSALGFGFLSAAPPRPPLDPEETRGQSLSSVKSQAVVRIIYRIIYLGDDDQLPSLGIDRLHQSGDGHVTDGRPPDVAHAIDSGYFLIGDGEEDIGLRLRATLWCDL